MQLLSKLSKREKSARLCAQAILDGLPSVMWFIRCHMRKHRTSGLSVPQFRALIYIDRFEDPTISAVGEHLGSTLPTASRLISGLIAKKFVVRKACLEDRRRCFLALTERGRGALTNARVATRDKVAEEISKLSTEEQRAIISNMTMLQNIFECKKR